MGGNTKDYKCNKCSMDGRIADWLYSRFIRIVAERSKIYNQNIWMNTKTTYIIDTLKSNNAQNLASFVHYLQ